MKRSSAVSYLLFALLALILLGIDSRAEKLTSADVIAAAASPRTIKSGDLNGDGRADLVYCESSNVRVLLSTTGGFRPENVYPAGVWCSDLQLGDVNGDNKSDIVVAGRNSANGIVSVLLNNGNGTFAEPKISLITVQTSVWPAPVAPVIADFDEDHVNDVVVEDAQNYKIFFAHGNGDGTFSVVGSINSANRAGEITAVDLNHDHHLDLVMKGGLSSDVLTFLGNGNGTFQAPTILYDGWPISSAAVADMNGDGVYDLLTIEYDQTNYAWLLRIRLGIGDGSFGNPVASFACPGSGWTVYSRDLNGDNRSDIIVIGVSGVSVLLAEGNLTYGPPAFYAATSSWMMTMADFNGDGAVDIATGASTIGILYGKPDGTFRAARSYLSGNSGGTAVADLNGDGLPDIVAASVYGAVSLMNHPNGEFTTILDQSASGYAGPIFLSDFNNDGKVDVVANESRPSGYDTQLGNGDGTFQSPVFRTDCPADGAYGVLAIPGDFTGDGDVDLALLGSFSLNVCTGNGDGSFTSSASQNIEFPFVQYAAITADLNHDGFPDLVAAKSPGIATLLNAGDGTGAMVLTNSYSLSNVPIGIAADDLNGDGNADIVLVDGQSLQVTTMLGDGQGGFGTPIITPTSNVFRHAGVADLNGDGKPDVVLTGASGVVSVFHGNGNGTFDTESSYVGGSDPATPSFADFNGDGAIDLTFANATAGTPTAGTVTVMLNRGGTKALITSSVEPSQYGQPVTLAVSLTESVPDSGVPTGTVHLSVGDLHSEGALVDGSYSYTTAALPVGQTPISASYDGDGTFNQRSIPAITHQVIKADTSTELTSSANPAAVGDRIVLTAAVHPAYSGIPTGTVVFSDGTTVLGEVPLNGSGIATFSISTLIAGTHNIKAAYAGDANYSVSNSTTLAQAVLYPTVIELTSNANAQLVGTALTFTIRVSSSTGTPSGNVTLREGASQLAQTALASGTASLQISSLTSGVHVLSASYGGSSIFSASSSSQLTQRVADFRVEVSPTTRTLNAGQSGTVTVTVSSIAEFSGALSMSCSGAPAQSTCTINPNSVTVNGANASATVTVTTTARNRAAINAARGSLTYASILYSGFLGFLGLVFAGHKMNNRWLLVSMAMVVFVLCSVGCGGGGNPGPNPPTGTPAGTSSLTVGANTTSGSVTVSHSAQFSLTVQ